MEAVLSSTTQKELGSVTVGRSGQGSSEISPRPHLNSAVHLFTVDFEAAESSRTSLDRLWFDHSLAFLNKETAGCLISPLLRKGQTLSTFNGIRLMKRPYV